MTRYSRSAPLTVRCTSLDVPADAVLLVHHVVAGAQLQRVDRVAPPARHLAHVLGGRAAAAGDVVAGDDGQPAAVVDEAVVEPAGGDDQLAGRRAARRSRRRARAPRPASRSTSAARWAGPCPSKTSATRQPSPVQPLEVVDHPRRSRRGRAATGWAARASAIAVVRARPPTGRRLAVQPRLVLGGRRAAASARPNGRHRPPRLAQRGGGRRAPRPGSGRRPRRGRSGALPPTAAAAQLACEELLAGAHQVVRPGADPLRVAQQHVRAGRHAVAAAAPASRRRRAAPGASDSMPSTGMPSASLSSISASSGCSLGQLARPGPAPRSVSSSSRHGGAHSRVDRLDGALVGHGEGADLLDLVAPELHPQRVLLGGREDVEDAAAHGELAALGDQIDPGVRDVGQPADDVVQVGPVARAQLAPAPGRRGP